MRNTNDRVMGGSRGLERYGRFNGVLRVLIWVLAFAGIDDARVVGDPSDPSNPFAWQEQAGEEVTLLEDGHPVFTYQLATRSLDGRYPRSNYLHPVWNTAGEVITEDFPVDHQHHRGLFWAWHQLAWKGTPLADPWNCENIRWMSPESGSGIEWVRTEVTDEQAIIEVVHDWQVPHPTRTSELIRVVRERVQVTTRRRQAETRVLDFLIELEALREGITLGGSNDDKGYGGFSPRIRLAEDVVFRGPGGRVIPQRTAVAAGGWVDVIGTIEGRLRGVAMMVDPNHPGAPIPWILRASRSMQNPRWPGREPVRLTRGDPVRLRYRVVLHDGSLTKEELTVLYQSFGRE